MPVRGLRAPLSSRRFRFRGALLTLSLGLLLLGPWARAQDGEVLDEIVAVVEDEIILRSDVNALVIGVIQQQQLPYSETLWFDALRELVDQKVILHYAREDTNVVISDEQVDGELDQRIDMLSSRAGGERQLEEFYGKSVLEIKDDMRERVREQLLAQEYQRQQFADLKVTPSEVRSFFAQFPQDSLPTIPETVRVSHIVGFPEIDPAARQEALGIINTLRDSVIGGASFEELAQQFSDDPGSAPNGGRYENMRLSELVPEFAAVASSVAPETISQVFESPFGYHFLRVNDRIGDIVDVNHILIRINEARVLPESTIERLGTIRDSLINQNMPFALMAKRHSEDEVSAARGGQVTNPQTGERDLPLDGLGPSWRRTLDLLAPGEISQPVETELLDGRKAYHIVRLERRLPEHQMNLAQDYARIEQFALQQKQQEEREAWVERLRKNLFIVLRVEEPEPPGSTASR